MESTDIRKAGLKVTLPRMRILEMFESSEERHLKAEDIYRMLLDSGEEIALATVYRVLTQFEAAGLVTRHHFEGGHAVFEVDDGEHHDHLVDVVLEYNDWFWILRIFDQRNLIVVLAGHNASDDNTIESDNRLHRILGLDAMRGLNDFANDGFAVRFEAFHQTSQVTYVGSSN